MTFAVSTVRRMSADEARQFALDLIASASDLSGLTEAEAQRLTAQAEAVGWVELQNLAKRTIRLLAAHAVAIGVPRKERLPLGMWVNKQ